MDLAREAINLYLNTKIVAAEEIFRYHKDDNHYVRMAQCFCEVLRAVTSLEHGDLEACSQTLRHTEKHISPSTSNLLAHISSSLATKHPPSETDLAELLQRQLMLADCQVCSAVLLFLQQEIGSFLKGAVGLRRAWKTYDRIYTRTRASNSHSESAASLIGHPEGTSTLSSTVDTDEPFPYRDSAMIVSCSSPCLAGAAAPPTPSDVPGTPPPSPLSPCPSTPLKSTSRLLGKMTRSVTKVKLANKSSRELSDDTLKTLAGSVSFGFGVFQLALSMMPDNVVKVVQMLGFQIDRGVALSALDFCRKSQDFRAPLAGLVLLAYHSALRPLLSLDGPNITAGLGPARLLLSELQPLYPRSPLLCYFSGRVQRLQRDLRGCIESQRAAMSLTEQREVRLLCLHEIGWCYLLQLDWPEAFAAFSQLADQTRWNKPFYLYLAAITVGARGDLSRARSLLARLAPAPTSAGRAARGASAEVTDFIDRRVSALTANDWLTGGDAAGEGGYESGGRLGYRLLAEELLYLWHALPSCSADTCRQILADCVSVCDPVSQLTAVAALVSGAVCDLTDLSAAEGHYRRALLLASQQQQQQQRPLDAYVAPFASYELAEIYCGRPQSCAEGRRLLLSARDNYSNYEFQQRLHMRIQSALKRLDQQTANK